MTSVVRIGLHACPRKSTDAMDSATSPVRWAPRWNRPSSKNTPADLTDRCSLECPAENKIIIAYK